MLHVSGTPDVQANPLVSAEDPAKGLTTAEAVDALARYGFNELPAPKIPFFVKLFAFACLNFNKDDNHNVATKMLNDTMSNTAIVVKRNGTFETMQSRDIVPGDVITVSAGLVLPADVRWVSGGPLQVDTSPMTGEVEPLATGASTMAGDCAMCVLATTPDARSSDEPSPAR